MPKAIFSLCVVLALLAPLAVHAQRSILVETRESSTPNGKPAYALVINGTVVARLAKPTVIGGLERTPQRGLALAAAVLAEAYRGGAASFSISGADDGREYTVKVNGRPLMVASDIEGKAWGATPQQLATTWQQNIEASLEGVAEIELAPAVQEAVAEAKRPPRVDKEMVPDVAQDSALLFEDEIPKPVKQQPATTGAAKPKPPQKPQTGAAKLATVKPATGKPASGNTTQSSVAVGKPAAPVIHPFEPPKTQSLSPMAVPQQYTAIVTGSSPSASMLKTAVDATIRVGAGLPDGTTVTWRPADEEFELPPLTPGTRVSVPSVYKVNADTNLVPVTLTLENRSIPAARETVTLFSNIPENVKKEQLLYYASLPAGQAGRLVYHHQNQSRGTLRFVARVVNPEGRPVALHITPGDTPPNLNTFFVGFQSAERFWQNLGNGSGYVLRVPAGGQAWIVAQDVEAGFTASGYYRLSNTSDTALRIETLALNPDTVAPKGAWPNSNEASCGVYPQPYITTTHNYNANAGAPWLYLRLGEDEPASGTDDTVHYGCYGVTHTYEVTVKNTKQSPALVFVVLRGSAGEVKGQFLINDEYVSTALVRGGEEEMLREIPLPPGATKKLRIKAIALNGSFYPASIILREERITIKY
ncbi:MAG: hypothetical protein M3R04_01930 [bacterium]|nr:hypothetical protein [bacterium]